MKTNGPLNSKSLQCLSLLCPTGEEEIKVQDDSDSLTLARITRRKHFSRFLFLLTLSVSFVLKLSERSLYNIFSLLPIALKVSLLY